MILALTCSSPVGSVALADSSGVVKTLSWESERSHAEFVAKNIQELMSSCGVQFSNLKSLCVDVGPGSFTGIRISINTIKTLSYVLNLPVFTCNSLEILAHQKTTNTLPITCMMDAFTSSVYFASYKKRLDSTPSGTVPSVVKSSEIKDLFKFKTLCLGDGFTKYSEELLPIKHLLVFDQGLSNFPMASDLANFFLKNKDSVKTKNWQEIEPLYIRRSSAEEKLLV